ncbi:MAG: hypothetical protein AAFY31_07810, partial [Pseudomonadota bacterium]
LAVDTCHFPISQKKVTSPKKTLIGGPHSRLASELAYRCSEASTLWLRSTKNREVKAVKKPHSLAAVKYTRNRLFCSRKLVEQMTSNLALQLVARTPDAQRTELNNHSQRASIAHRGRGLNVAEQDINFA